VDLHTDMLCGNVTSLPMTEVVPFAGHTSADSHHRLPAHSLLYLPLSTSSSLAHGVLQRGHLCRLWRLGRPCEEEDLPGSLVSDDGRVGVFALLC
jgi:hypothetical protein